MPIHIHRLRELPRASCVLQLDSATDIFRAKGILSDPTCTMGNIPATHLKLGTVDAGSDQYTLRHWTEPGMRPLLSQLHHRLPRGTYCRVELVGESIPEPGLMT
jgi:hypothetical protein